MVEVSKRAIRWADDSDPVGEIAIRLAARASAVEEQCGEWTWRDIADLVASDTKTETAMLREALEAENARLKKVLKFCLDEAQRANKIIALNRDGQGQGRIGVATVMHRIEHHASAALTGSKS